MFKAIRNFIARDIARCAERARQEAVADLMFPDREQFIESMVAREEYALAIAAR